MDKNFGKKSFQTCGVIKLIFGESFARLGDYDLDLFKNRGLKTGRADRPGGQKLNRG
jgi:hypothetical protein